MYFYYENFFILFQFIKINICEIKKKLYIVLKVYFYLNFYFKFIIMNNNNYKTLLDKYNFLSNSLINNIFKTTNDDLKKLLIKNDIKTRNNKISFSDVFLYKFLYTYKDVSKQYIVSKFNYDNELLIN